MKKAEELQDALSLIYAGFSGQSRSGTACHITGGTGDRKNPVTVPPVQNRRHGETTIRKQ
jgi:hypothetical protein